MLVLLSLPECADLLRTFIMKEDYLYFHPQIYLCKLEYSGQRVIETCSYLFPFWGIGIADVITNQEETIENTKDDLLIT